MKLNLDFSASLLFLSVPTHKTSADRHDRKEMPSATAIGLSPEVLVQSSLEQRIGVWQTQCSLRDNIFFATFQIFLVGFYIFQIIIKYVSISRNYPAQSKGW